MSEPTKEYLEGEMRAVEEDAGIGTPGPFSNPYDDWTDPGKHYDFACGYNNAIKNLREKSKEEGSWYGEDDTP
jgi:hypothetical protein